jgi:hypothetical protein
MKFACPRGGTNPITNKTITPDDVIGEIIQLQATKPSYQSQSAHLESSVAYSGALSKTTTHSHSRNLQKFDLTALRTPYNILGKEDQKWKAKFPDKLFDGSYHAG